MNRVALNYIQNQISQGSHRLRGHITDTLGKVYPKRPFYKKIEKCLEDFISKKTEQRWVVIPGLRGVGKTTILAQIFLSLTSRYDITRLLYISLDEVTTLLGSNLAETLEAFESILGKSFEKLEEPVFIFVDEAQYDPNWGVALKTLFDKTKKVFILTTGSSAISLQANTDIHRRAFFNKLYPLSFTESQNLKHEIKIPEELSHKLKQAVYFSKNTGEIYKSLSLLKSEVLQYWSRVDKYEIQNYLINGTLPFALGMETTRGYESILGLLDKMIAKDIESLKLFDAQTVANIKRLLFLLADANDVLSVSKLPNLVGIGSSITIQRVFSVLEQAELLIRIPPYGSQKSRITKPSKYLFMSPSIRMALLGLVGKETSMQTRMGKLLEDAVGLHLRHELKEQGEIAYDQATGGADFILQMTNQKEIVIEVGMGKKDLTQVKNTMEKIKSDIGILISDNELEYHQKEKIISLPLQYFFLM